MAVRGFAAVILFARSLFLSVSSLPDRHASAPRGPLAALAAARPLPQLTSERSPGAGSPPTIDEADYEAFEGLFESARMRRATQQRATTGVEDATTTMQERVYGAVLSPRVIRSGLDSWTRAVSSEAAAKREAPVYSACTRARLLGSVGNSNSACRPGCNH